MIHDCVQRHTSSSPPRAPSPSPDGTAAPRMDTPAPPWWQQPPFSCLKENNQNTSEHSWSGDYVSSFEIPRTSLPSSGYCASSIFIHGFKLALFLFFLNSIPQFAAGYIWSSTGLCPLQPESSYTDPAVHPAVLSVPVSESRFNKNKCWPSTRILN